MEKKHSEGVISAIGNTPLVTLENINPVKRGGVKILAKLEGNNPGGSVKDRIAWYMVKDAEDRGLLTKDKIILEPTSGNTGIGLAMVGAARGYRVKLVMPECVSMERRMTLEAFGAELILSPGCEGTDGAIRMAHKIYDDNKDVYFMPDQFNNPANIRAHYETTGVEVYEQTKGQISMFVAGMGTTGTLMGTGKRLKEYDSSIKIVGVEPILGHKIQGLKNMAESIVPGILDLSKLDEKINVVDDDAFTMARNLAVKEGLFVGMSSGAAVHAAVTIAKGMKDGMIVVILPDRGDRYLSTTLFKSICADCPP
ncbi:PLP-dependent cysteine synthase family protein [Candidatus Magnetomonas plexicatena]|uniref:PLP-dependent cysteine synthase family protein n=1 Tax=Candidatus Magnetomonas plexicatena TaxID=2552947 RepID=UPI00110352CB|nr:cysteine synthase [Nitrospirales bacterium LBB_01]